MMDFLVNVSGTYLFVGKTYFMSKMESLAIAMCGEFFQSFHVKGVMPFIKGEVGEPGGRLRVIYSFFVGMRIDLSI